MNQSFRKLKKFDPFGGLVYMRISPRVANTGSRPACRIGRRANTWSVASRRTVRFGMRHPVGIDIECR